jgi:hypothetical protein
VSFLLAKGDIAMSAHIYFLAEDDTGKWQLVFHPDQLHLYVEFTQPGTVSKPDKWISIDGFLAWAPRNPLHRRALDCFVAFLAEAILLKA